jgi:uncharacterized protein YerC
MRRRELIQGAAAALFAGGARAGRQPVDCGCSFQMRGMSPAAAFEPVGSRIRVTAMKVFGVSLSAGSDRPYVFVKLETNQGISGATKNRINRSGDYPNGMRRCVRLASGKKSSFSTSNAARASACDG